MKHEALFVFFLYVINLNVTVWYKKICFAHFSLAINLLYLSFSWQMFPFFVTFETANRHNQPRLHNIGFTAYSDCAFHLRHDLPITNWKVLLQRFRRTIFSHRVKISTHLVSIFLIYSKICLTYNWFAT